jgi:hypothetical protein
MRGLIEFLNKKYNSLRVVLCTLAKRQQGGKLHEDKSNIKR